jgi:DnaD/phage-associated family protein
MYTWWKMHFDTVEDPRVKLMSDWLYRRFTLFLYAAAKYNHAGLLEPLRYLACRVGLTEPDVQRALQELGDLGLLAEIPGKGWQVVGFAESQAVTGAAERMRRLRARQRVAPGSVPFEPQAGGPQQPSSSEGTLDDQDDERNDDELRNGVRMSDDNEAAEQDSSSASASESDSYSASASESDSYSDSVLGEEGVGGGDSMPNNKPNSHSARRKHTHRSKRSDLDRPPDPTPEVAAAYDENIGPVTPLVAKVLVELENKFTTAWLLAAFDEAVRSNGRNLKYIEAILCRWKRDGVRSPRVASRHGIRSSGPSRGSEVQETVDLFLGRKT